MVTSSRVLPRAPIHGWEAWPDRALALVAVVLVVAPAALADVPLGQDLPQHIAYAKVLSLLQRGDGLAASLYERAAFHPYSSVHYALGWLLGFASPVTMGKVLLVLYALLHAASFLFLRRAVRPGTRVDSVEIVLLPLVVWNPVVWMGFASFFLALPALWTAYALARRVMEAERPRPADVALLACASFIACGLHVWVGAALGGMIVGTALGRTRGRFPHGATPPSSLDGSARNTAVAAAVALSAIGCAAAFAFAGGGGSEWGGRARLGEIVRELGGRWESEGTRALAHVFGLEWASPLVRLEYAAVAVFGTVPRTAKLIVALAMLAVFGATWTGGEGRRDETLGRHSAALSAPSRGGLWALGLLAAFVPSSMRVPEVIGFVDLRFVTLLVILCFAHAPPFRRTGTASQGAFTRASRLTGALSAFAWVPAVVCGWCIHGVGTEGRGVRRAIEELPRDAEVLWLPFADESAHADGGNALLHYAGVWHTARGGGFTSAFWGSYGPHLPVRLRPEVVRRVPEDWNPRTVDPSMLARFTHVVALYPAEGPLSDAQLVASSPGPSAHAARHGTVDERVARIHGLLVSRARRVQCAGSLCVFELRATPATGDRRQSPSSASVPRSPKSA